MKKLKVVSVVGTRPEIIRLSRVLVRLDEYCDHVLVHTGQNYDYELNQVFFEDLGLRKPDHFLNSAADSVAQTIANIIAAVDSVLAQVKPEALLVLGDTNSCLAVIAAKRRKIAIFHMEAGNRCFDQRVPEEINRRIVDHTADINLTYSAIAREYLLREGLPPDMIIKTGSPMFEVLTHQRAHIDASDVLAAAWLLSQTSSFVVSAHREENIDAPRTFAKLVAVLNAWRRSTICRSSCRRIRARRSASQRRMRSFIQHVRLMKPLGYHDYVKLQLEARAVLSDSGTITEESSILNFPALNLRETHERPEGMEEAAVMMVGLEVERVRQALAVLAQQPRGAQRLLPPVAEYMTPNVSEKVVRIIHSYTDYVNRVVWRRYD